MSVTGTCQDRNDPASELTDCKCKQCQTNIL